MENKKYDKVPLNQVAKSSSSNDINKQINQALNSSNFIKRDDISIQKTKSTVSIKNKKSVSEKNFPKEEPTPPPTVFFIRTKDNNDLKINLEQVSHYTILELKKHSFPVFFEENKNIRLIFKGKQLQDNEIVHKSNIKVGDFIHAFISEKVEKPLTPLSNTTNISNFENSRSNNIRGFERMREFGISEQEIILQRFKYHTHFSLIDKEENLEATNLANREDEWYAMNLEQITNNIPHVKKWFRNYNFYEEIQKELLLNYNYFEMFIASIIGFFIFFLSIFFIFCKKNLNSGAQEGLMIGIILKLIYISVNFHYNGEIRWLI